MSLPITPLLWLAAAAPLAAVLVLLIGLRWSASSAASVGYFLAAIARSRSRALHVASVRRHQPWSCSVRR